MTVALMASMGYQLWGDVAHEWIGTGMYGLFVAHHLLNFRWYRAMFRGRYTGYRIAQLITDVLVFVAMIGLMVSGVMLSSHIFTFIPLGSGIAFARLLHMLASYWGFVLMALHLGLHWGVVIGIARRFTGTTTLSPIARLLLTAAGIAMTAYGIYVFIDRELPTYMFLQTLFVFLDYEESKVLFYVDYLAMMGAFVWIGHKAAMLLRKRSVVKLWRHARPNPFDIPQTESEAVTSLDTSRVSAKEKVT
jgi:hypothetical protein